MKAHAQHIGAVGECLLDAVAVVDVDVDVEDAAEVRLQLQQAQRDVVHIAVA